MNDKMIYFIAISFLASMGVICTASQEGVVEPNADGCVLQIHLPREVTISDSLLKLGEIVVIAAKSLLLPSAAD